jgi:ABC-2 type transport system ATP-binding protein
MSDIAIKIDHVSKDFVLPHERVNSVKGLFTSIAKGRKSGAEVQRALRDVNFEVKKGEFFGIVGRNGSGKSTLLKMLAGIYQPSKGTISTVGKLVPFIELGVGFNPELTGSENVYLNGALLGFSHREIVRMYDDIVQFAELERFMDQKLKNYSSGMQVRLAFSMATRSKADILLIDEVLAVGDADFQRKCFDYFHKLKKNKKTVVFVSHDMEAVREYCDRAVLINEGEVAILGNTDAVAQAYTKLFTNTAVAAASADEAPERWGDGAAVTTAIKAKASANQIEIVQTITAKVAARRLLAGFRLRSTAGAAVTGTNTKLEKSPLPPLKAGQSVTVTWRLPNVLSDGQYIVDPAIVHDDGVTVADWWDDATTVQVRKQRHLPYVIDPEFVVELSEVTKVREDTT